MGYSDKTCKQCNKAFSKPTKYSLTQWEGKKFCSNKCAALNNRNVFRAGMEPWNKGTVGVMKTNKTSWKKKDPRVSGTNHRQWSGEHPSYATVHKWVSKKLGSPNKCDNCGTTEKRMYHWSNRDGKYSRNLSDWWRLCVPCHSSYDKSLREELSNA